MMTNTIKILVLMMALLVPGFASAGLELDAITYDPAIIASGDEVDVIIQFHHEPTMFDEQRINNPEYEFRVLLQSDDSLSEQYLRIVDAEGNDMRSSVLSGGYYNKRFRVKVSQVAPPGNYELKLIGEWYFNDKPTGDQMFVRFMMPVKKEGIILDIASYDTSPSDVRAADNYVEIRSFIENSGEKGAESIEAILELPEGITSSYSNNNRVWVGSIPADSSKELNAYIDIDEDIEPGVYELVWELIYRDEDRNEYSKTETVPLLVRKSPYLEVSSYTGSGVAGGSAELSVTIKNTGSERAEAIDVRLMPQSSQPFTMDVRSQYLGSLDPGEEGTVVFDMGVSRDAAQTEHDISVLLRAKGDSDEGDDNIYTYSRRASININGQAKNFFLWSGIVLAGAILILMMSRILRRKKK